MRWAGAVAVLVMLALGALAWQRAAKSPDTPAETAEMLEKPHTVASANMPNASLAQKLADVLQAPAPSPTSLVPTLHQAVAAGDIYAVADLIKRGVHLDNPGTDGRTPFLEAALKGNAHVLNFLLDAGADADARDRFGNSAIHLAVQANNVYMLNNLVIKGLPLLVRNNEHYTPMHIAAQEGALESAAYLFRLPLDFVTTPPEITLLPPMHLAGRNQQWGITELLWQLGATYFIREAAAFGDMNMVKRLYANDPSSVNETERLSESSPLLQAVVSNHEDIATFLIINGAQMYHFSHYYDSMGVAIVLDHLNMIPLLIGHGYSLDKCFTGLQKESPIHLCIRRDKMETLDLLLSYGPNLNRLSNEGLGAIHLALMEDRPEYVEKLVTAGADINLNDKHCKGRGCAPIGNSPLHWAVDLNKKAFVELLLQHGADTNNQRPDGQTPLHLAVQSNSDEFVPILLEHGASVAIVDNGGATPLHAAAQFNKAEWVTALLEAGADIEAQDKEGRRPLHIAANHDSETALIALLEQGANIEAHDFVEKTPLYTALESGKNHAAQALIARGADVHTQNREKRNLLYPAIQSNLVAETEMLLQAGLEIHHTDFQGVAPIHIAAQFGKEETLNFLLERGANPNVRDRFDQTPMHLAADRGDTVMVRALLLGGGDLRAVTRWGELPIHRSASNGHWSCIHYFLMADSQLTVNTPDAKGNTPLHLALRSNKPALVEVLIDRGADILAHNERGFTPLSAVSQMRYATIHPHDDRQLELRRRENFAIMTHYLRSALHDRLRAAIIQGNTKGAETLLKEEPSLLDFMTHGETPLHVAARTGQADAVKLLLELGANPKHLSQTQEAGTALELAERAGNEEIVALLRDAA